MLLCARLSYEDQITERYLPKEDLQENTLQENKMLITFHSSEEQ